MNLDLNGLLIFTLFVLPGVVAQKARDSLVPRSLTEPTVAAELGEYLLSSFWVHLPLLLLFREIVIWLFGFTYLGNFVNDLITGAGGLVQHGGLASCYMLSALAVAQLVGLVRAWQVRRRLIQKFLLKRLGISWQLRDEPVWYSVLKTDNKRIFVEAEMRDDKGFYTGILSIYGLVSDSERDKDFYIRKAWFKPNAVARYRRLRCHGVLLNSCDVVSLKVAARPRAVPQKVSPPLEEQPTEASKP